MAWQAGNHFDHLIIDDVIGTGNTGTLYSGYSMPAWNMSWASTTMPYTEYAMGFTIREDQTNPTKKENTVNVYLIVLIDAMEGEILRHDIFLGKDQSGATAGLGLTKDEQKHVTRGDWAIVISQLGSYEAPKITRTKAVD